MHLFLPLLSLIVACEPGKTTDTAVGEDSGVEDTSLEDTDREDSGTEDSGAEDSGGEDTGTPSLHGTIPDEALPAPDFNATNRDGTARSNPDLVGSPHVLWFYPAAFTGG